MSHGLYEIYDYLWILMVLFCIDNSIIEPKLLIVTILIALLIPSILGFYQSIVYIFTGTVPALPFQMFFDQEEIASSYNVYTRICSCFHDPSYFAAILASAITLSTGLLLSYDFKYENRIIKKISFILLVVSVLPMLMTMSGTGFIALFIGLLLMSLFSFSFKKIFKIILLILVIIAAIFILISVSNVDFLNGIFFKLSHQLNNDGGIFYSRKPFYLVGLKSFLSSPIWGVGIGNLEFVGISTQSSAHCTLLTILAEQGIIVFIPTIFLIFVYPINDLKFYNGPCVKTKKQDIYREQLLT